jgi:hypothetical protein
MCNEEDRSLIDQILEAIRESESRKEMNDVGPWSTKVGRL